MVENAAVMSDMLLLAEPHPAYIPATRAAASLEPAAADLTDANVEAHDPAMPAGFRRRHGRMERCVLTKDGTEQWLPFCSPLRVLAQEHGFDGRGWGLRVEVEDPNGKRHEVTIPRSVVLEGGAALRQRLSDVGLDMPATAAARSALTAFLGEAKPRRRIVAANKIGWNGRAFVLPDESFGIHDGTEVAFHCSFGEHRFRQSGTLEDWQKNVALPCRSNTRLQLALCVGIAAPLAKLVAAEGGGVHLVGRSSTGKSTALFVAGSFWGGGGARANLRPWRSTAAALESLAHGHSDTALMLDEIGQADARDVHTLAYSLANSQGKLRSNGNGGKYIGAEWRLSFVSTGEVTLAQKFAEGGRRPYAGQAVRIIDIGLPDAGMGLFERLPEGCPSPAAFATQLRQASTASYGTACRPFLRQLVEHQEAVADALRDFIARFVAAHCPPTADSQVHRVAERMALYACAGEIGIGMNILPWGEGEATAAVAACFQSWLQMRGHIGQAELHMAVAQLQELVQHHACQHLDLWHRNRPGRAPYVEVRVADRWGFRSIGRDGAPEFWLNAHGWQQVSAGCPNSYAVAQEMIRLGLLERARDGKSSVLVAPPGLPKGRYYHITPGTPADDEATE